MILLGKTDFYIVQTLLQIDAIYFNLKFCTYFTFVSHITRYPHNLMPFFIGFVILQFIHFMSRTAMKMENQDSYSDNIQTT